MKFAATPTDKAAVEQALKVLAATMREVALAERPWTWSGPWARLFFGNGELEEDGYDALWDAIAESFESRGARTHGPGPRAQCSCARDHPFVLVAAGERRSRG